MTTAALVWFALTHSAHAVTITTCGTNEAPSGSVGDPCNGICTANLIGARVDCDVNNGSNGAYVTAVEGFSSQPDHTYGAGFGTGCNHYIALQPSKCP